MPLGGYMGLFDKKQVVKEANEEGDESKKFAQQILKQPDRLAFLIEIFKNLPYDLTKWFQSYLKSMKTTHYIEVEIAVTLSSDLYYPGDIIIRTNRDPKPKDIVEITYRSGEDYESVIFNITRINLKEGTIDVQSRFNENNETTIAINNIISIIDEIVSFGTPRWKNIIKTLNVDFDKRRVVCDVENTIKQVEEIKDFHKKKENLDKLKQRLKEVKAYKD